MEKIRKLRHNLYISGIGVILLGVWGCMKIFMTAYFSKEGIDTSSIEEEYIQLFYILVLIMLIIISVIIIAFHLYVGLSAMKAGKKGIRKKAYLFVAAFMGLITLSTIVGDVEVARDDISQIDVAIAAMLVDFTFIFIIIDIIYSSVKLGKLEKEL